MRYLKLTLVALVMFSCSKNLLLKRDIGELKVELAKMKYSDQLIRKHKQYVDYYFGIDTFYFKRDSLTWNDSLDGLSQLLENRESFRTESIRLNEKKKNDYEGTMESIDYTMKYLDSINTKRLIEITRKYGFPDYERLKYILGEDDNAIFTSSPQLIFVHAPEYYFKEIKIIVSKEYLKGRMSKNACSHILWHINGRKGDPFPKDLEHCTISKKQNEN
jgi:hypothetical protein